MTDGRTPTAHDLARVAERAGQSPALLGMGLAAEAYARLGLRVIPLHHPTPGGCSCANILCRDQGKHPRTARGVKDATSDVETIRAWWFSHPYSNVGIATGHLVDVIDVDTKEAARSVADLRAANRMPAVIASATTGRLGGGSHLYVAAAGAGCTAPPVEGLDYRGRGGYVVAPPSVHASGAEYAWGTGPMPLGVAERAHALGLMPWERIHSSPTPGGSRESAYAVAMLHRQEQQVSQALPGRRVPRLLSAANNLGSVVGAAWISEQRVTDALMSAYWRAGGADDRAARHAIDSGLRRGRGLDLPDLGPPATTTDPRELVNDIVAWMHSPRSHTPGLARGRVATLDVLRGILVRADERQRACVVVSVRDAQLWGGYASTSPARKALLRLVRAGVLSRVEGSGRDPGAAHQYRLQVPASVQANDESGAQDTVGVSEGSITACAPDSQTRAVTTHALWGSRRGHGFGLTRHDRLLFATATTEAGVGILTSVWANEAGVSHRTVYDACRDTADSLTAMGLVERIGRGTVVLTPRGVDIAAAVQGRSADLGALDDLADELGVASRKCVREGSVAAARAADRSRLTPKMLRALIDGRLASKRVPAVLREVMGADVVAAVPSICGGLDMATSPGQARRAVRDLLASLEGWTPGSGQPIRSPDSNADLRQWLSESDATDVGEEVAVLAHAWWQAHHIQQTEPAGVIGATTYLGAVDDFHAMAAGAVIAALARTPRCSDAPKGYAPLDFSRHRNEAA